MIRCIFISSFQRWKLQFSILFLSEVIQKILTSIHFTITFSKKTDLIKILLLWYWLKSDQMAQKNRASFSLSWRKKRKLFRTYYSEIRCLRQNFWIALSRLFRTETYFYKNTCQIFFRLVLHFLQKQKSMSSKNRW
jgi:hypothetical protein